MLGGGSAFTHWLTADIDGDGLEDAVAIEQANGLWQWAKSTKWASPIAEFFFPAQESGSATVADSQLPSARFSRINRPTASDIELDNAALNDLVAWGEEFGEQTFQQVRHRFLDGSHAHPWKRYGASGSKSQ